MRVLGAYIFLLFSCSASAAPSACSFYNDSRLNAYFWSCAEPTIKRQSCTKIKGVCPACIKYKGDKGMMFMPDFFIEVTSRLGESQFAGYPPLKAQLDAAKSYYGGLVDWASDGSSDETERSSFWHVRIIQPPFGSTAFLYLDMPLYGVATAVAPTCFQGISEYLKDQWNLNLADAPFALAWAPIGLKVCNLGTASVSPSDIQRTLSKAKGLGAEGGVDIPSIPAANCAFPLDGTSMRGLNLKPSSDALSFKKLCMRGLGNLIPREGTQDTEDPFISALQAAWKFLSLVKDMHPHTGVSIEDEYKWQIVHPKVDPLSSRCFRPGGLEGLILPAFGPLEQAKLRDSDSYIFALWRPRQTSSCYEPETAELLWRQRIKLADYNVFKGRCLVQ